MTAIMKIEGDCLICDGKRISIPSLRPIEVIGKGANGYAVLCDNEFLSRKEVVKIWLKLRPNDSRDKIKQGMFEARKIADAKDSSWYVADIYQAGIIKNEYFFASFEYIHGETLDEWLKIEKSPVNKLQIALLYLQAIIVTTNRGAIHGDPHSCNVILRINEERLPEERFTLKLIDFGTSHFSKEGLSLERHWRIVDKTVDQILGESDIYRSFSRRPTKSDVDENLEYFTSMLYRICEELDNHYVERPFMPDVSVCLSYEPDERRTYFNIFG